MDKLSVTAETMLADAKNLGAGPQKLYLRPGVPVKRQHAAYERLVQLRFLRPAARYDFGQDHFRTVEVTEAGHSHERPIKPGELTATDLVVGGLYRGKRPKRCGFGTDMDDRVIIFMNPLDTGEHRVLQYDSYAVRDGRHYPSTDVGKFLRWSSHRINQDGTRWTDIENEDY